MPNVIEILKERGFIESMTSEELASLADKPLKVYCGFDPTGDSLHLGNMVAIMGLAWFQRCGHTPVAIVGGATGMIGDPSGKSSERQLLDDTTIQQNLIGIRRDLEKILTKPRSAQQLRLVQRVQLDRIFARGGQIFPHRHHAGEGERAQPHDL